MGPPRAPRGPGKSRSSAPASGRENTRGGVGKRSSARPGPKDQDGDVNMDTTLSATRGGRANKSSSNARNAPANQQSRGKGGSTNKGPVRASARVSQAVVRHLNGEGADMVKKREHAPLVWLDIKGLSESKAANNSGRGLRELLSFVERKATGLTQRAPPVVIKQSRQKGPIVEVGAAREDAEEIIKINGFTFAGAKLQITDHNGSLAEAQRARAASDDVKAKLTNILSLRYATDMKLLKLDGLSQDPALVEMGMLESKERAEKLLRAMMKICDDLFKTAKEKVENIHSISLANNGIDSIAPVEFIVETFPDLLHLDLSNNNFPNASALARWKNRFRKLETLYLAGNPIDIADPKIRAELVQLFPKLKDINGEQLTPEHKEQLRSFTKPRPVPQHGPDFRDANGLGEAFLVDVFVGFDNDRHGLLAKYYDDESQFSLNVDTNSIRDKDGPQPLPWATYIPKSRNFTRITTDAARRDRLLTGREAIFASWTELPATKHPDIKADTSKYIMDCHLLPGLGDPVGQSPSLDGMIISVHGQFQEQDASTKKEGLRSFSRSFVLGPGKPGNHTIRVVSDMLSLRAFNPLPNVFAAPTAAPAATAPEAANEAELRQAKIAELCKQTMMTPMYSEMCLSDSGWDFDKAISVFNEKKAVLPPEAFNKA